MDQVARSKTMLIYVGIFSIVMLFAGLTSAYVVTMGGGYWVDINLPQGFYYSTIVIVLSSLVYWWGTKQYKEGRYKNYQHALIITFLMGLAFTYFQFQAYNELVEKGNYFTGDIGNISGVYGEDYTISYQGSQLVLEENKLYMPNDIDFRQPLNSEINKQFNAASSYFYVLSGLHLLHLFGGLLYLFAIIMMSFLGRLDEKNSLKPKLAGIYWHFLDFLWVYLFFFLLLIH
jgi:cytochrome c oxidase subunit 3